MGGFKGFSNFFAIQIETAVVFARLMANKVLQLGLFPRFHGGFAV
jgi:hypothetical protein